jgi:hypothetical protein
MFKFLGLIPSTAKNKTRKQIRFKKKIERCRLMDNKLTIVAFPLLNYTVQILWAVSDDRRCYASPQFLSLTGST